MQFSFSLVCSGIFVAYIINSIYSLVQIYMPPTCEDDQYCLKSFLTTKPKLQLILCTSLNKDVSNVNQLQLVDQWSPLDYSKGEPIVKNVSISIPKQTRNNGSLHLFAFVTEIPRQGASENWKQSIQTQTTMNAYFSLTEYMVPEAKSFNLLNSNKEEEDKSKEDTKKDSKEKKVTHITKKLRLGMMTELHSLSRKELPMEVAYLIRILNSDTYLPPLKFDKFASRLKHFEKLNSSDERLDLEFEFASASIGSLRMAAQFEIAMETMTNQFGFSEKDLDEIKAIFSDTNVYLLGITMFVASIHLLFDFLAFKNDVVFWSRKKSIAGLSSKTILWRCFAQIVVFLYLMEEKSSLLVIVPTGIGAIIEVWKVKKAFKMSLEFRGILPYVSFGAQSESEIATIQHDVQSMKYLSYILYPLCLGGAIYSLLYTPHKSWYSWTIQSLVNGVYAFGFLFMLPQLFVNYKLKSVAQLPWRAFMYKAFNTFIDDLFAFIITMPTAHRVACFRDDVVFLIYLYQRWLYPVDQSRLDAGGQFELEADAPQPQSSTTPSDSTPQVRQVEDKKTK